MANRSNRLIVILISYSKDFSFITLGSYRKSPNRMILYGHKKIIYDKLYDDILAASSTMIIGDSGEFDC